MNNSENSRRKKANTTLWKPASAAIAQDQQDFDLNTDSAQANVAIAFPEYRYIPSSSFLAHVMIATDIAALLAKTSKNNAFLDSGATHHLSPHWGHFHNDTYTLLQQRIPIYLGDSSTIYAIATGTLQYMMDTPTGDAIPVEITNALHVSNMSCTLLSVSQFAKNGWYTITFKGKQAIIIHAVSNSIIGLAHLTMNVS